MPQRSVSLQQTRVAGSCAKLALLVHNCTIYMSVPSYFSGRSQKSGINIQACYQLHLYFTFAVVTILGVEKS